MFGLESVTKVLLFVFSWMAQMKFKMLRLNLNFIENLDIVEASLV